MKKLALTLLSSLLLVACDDGGNASDESGSTTGGQTSDPDTGENTNPSAPDPTVPTGPTSDTDDDPSEGDASSEGGEASSGGGDTTEGDTDGEPIDPSELPFGGYVNWSVQDLFAYGNADFYELPNDPTYEPSETELPLGEPVAEDAWEDLTAPPKPPGPEFEFPQLDVGPQLFADGGGASFTFEFSEESGLWDMGFFDFKEPYAGGDWSVDFPGNADFPAETFEDVLTGHAMGAAGLEIIVGGNFEPTQLSWTPLEGAHSAYVFVGAFGDGGSFMPLCSATLADDGEADIPPACVGLGDVPIDPNTFNTWFMLFGQSFEADVAYGEHRLRLNVNLGSQNDLVFPFEG